MDTYRSVGLTDPDAKKSLTEVAKAFAYLRTVSISDIEVFELPAADSDYEASHRPRQVQNHQNKPRTEAVIDAYAAGVPVKEIAAEFGIARQTVTEICKREGVALRPKRALSPSQIQEAARRYDSGDSLVAVGKYLRVDAETVRHALRAAGPDAASSRCIAVNLSGARPSLAL